MRGTTQGTSIVEGVFTTVLQNPLEFVVSLSAVQVQKWHVHCNKLCWLDLMQLLLLLQAQLHAGHTSTVSPNL